MALDQHRQALLERLPGPGPRHARLEERSKQRRHRVQHVVTIDHQRAGLPARKRGLQRIERHATQAVDRRRAARSEPMAIVDPRRRLVDARVGLRRLGRIDQTDRRGLVQTVAHASDCIEAGGFRQRAAQPREQPASRPGRHLLVAQAPPERAMMISQPRRHVGKLRHGLQRVGLRLAQPLEQRCAALAFGTQPRDQAVARIDLGLPREQRLGLSRQVGSNESRHVAPKRLGRGEPGAQPHIELRLHRGVHAFVESAAQFIGLPGAGGRLGACLTPPVRQFVGPPASRGRRGLGFLQFARELSRPLALLAQRLHVVTLRPIGATGPGRRRRCAGDGARAVGGFGRNRLAQALEMREEGAEDLTQAPPGRLLARRRGIGRIPGNARPGGVGRPLALQQPEAQRAHRRARIEQHRGGDIRATMEIGEHAHRGAQRLLGEDADQRSCQRPVGQFRAQPLGHAGTELEQGPEAGAQLACRHLARTKAGPQFRPVRDQPGELALGQLVDHPLPDADCGGGHLTVVDLHRQDRRAGARGWSQTRCYALADAVPRKTDVGAGSSAAVPAGAGVS